VKKFETLLNLGATLMKGGEKLIEGKVFCLEGERWNREYIMEMHWLNGWIGQWDRKLGLYLCLRLVVDWTNR